MQVAQVALCSQINTKHINTVWAEGTITLCNKLKLIEKSSQHNNCCADYFSL
jgi:hypothetical protein